MAKILPWLVLVGCFIVLGVSVVVDDEREPQRLAVTATAPACKTTKRLLVVNLDNVSQRGTLRHVWAATAHGQPAVLHKLASKAEADEHRDESLKGIPLWSKLKQKQRERLDPDHWREPHDRDEYPPAATDEGGTGADVAYVLRGDNRSAGQSMGSQLADYCDGQRWRFERKPGPRR